MLCKALFDRKKMHKYLKLEWIVSACLMWSCSSANVKLSSEEVESDQRIVFGKLVAATPDTKDLGITYILKDKAERGLFSYDENFPNIDSETGYFWIAVPKSAKYFGVRSIQFGHKGTGSLVGTLSDEQNDRPLLGSSIIPGQNPIYVGDISIATELASGQQKNLTPEARLSVRGVTVAKDSEAAKKFLTDRGIQGNQMIDSALKPVQGF
jgi:hypothetical protein